ncbi:MAG TPA: hypothetical protein DCZ03_15845 [Gammaproteobacteria bacterium]|nr:hypothetical protein [Gammaproteobacteria bacterium]
MTRYHSSGFAMMAVVSLLIALGIISYLLIMQGGQGANQNQSLADRDMAAYLAEAAINHAKWQAESTSCGTYSDLAITNFGTHQYSASFANTSGSPVSITATGTTENGANVTITREQVPIYDSTQTVTYSGSSDIDDTFLEDGQPTTNYNATTYLQISNDTTVTEQALLKINLSAIPPDAYVQNATLTLNLESIGSGASSGTLYAYRVTQQWQPSEATWNEYETSQSWAIAGGDKHDQIWASAPINSSGGTVTLNITNLVNVWISKKADNEGLLLAVSSNIIDAQLSSSEHASTSLQPTLQLSYACECGLPCLPDALYYEDQFNSFSCTTGTDYTNTDGPIDWSNEQWDETETDNSCAGDIQLATDDGDTRLQIGGNNVRISRQLTLDVFTSPTLSFDYRRENLSNTNQYMAVEVSLNGSSWTELGRITGSGTDGTYQQQSYDLTPYNGNTIFIRFSSRRLYSFFSRSIYVDNVRIDDATAGGGGNVTVDIVANADTWIYEGNPNTNYGTDVSLRTGRQGGFFSGDFSRALMHFDIASNVPAGSTVVTATLGVEIVSTNGSGTMTTNIYRVNTAWDENTDTWNTLGGGSWETSSIYSGDLPSSTGWQNLTLNSSLVQEWVDGTFTNRGIIFVYSAFLNKRREFGSLNDADTTIHPVLSITYTPP